jgi:pimeloyl-ACP methyl ester carboxylesterase
MKPWAPATRNLAITFIALGLLMLVGCQALVRAALFYPTHEPFDGGLAPWTHAGTLFGYARNVTAPQNVWLLLHGNAGQAADRVYALARFSDQDAVYVMEYPGYGARPGKPSRKTFDAAALAAYQALRAQFPDRPVCVAAESIGSGPAATLAHAAQPPDKLVFITPFDQLKSVAHEHVPYLPVSLMLAGSWNNIEALSGYRGPVDVFGAAQDTVIPIAHARNLAASLPQAKFVMIPGGHNDWSRQTQVSIRNP